MNEVVAEINANNSRVPTLYAHHFYEANVIDAKGQNHFVSGDGVLLYESPISMRLVASSVVGTVFEIGSNPQTFWLKLGPEAGDTMWWGGYANFNQLDLDHAGIPIRPDMVLDVLGIATINTNFNDLPTPVMRFVAADDAYVFLWMGKLPDRWVALREVWYDRQTKRPRRVLLYDPHGRVVLRGDLGAYRQLPVEGQPKAQWPTVPGDYKLRFPDSGSRLQFTFDSAELRHKSQGLELPVKKSFRMPSPQNAGVNRVIQIGPSGGE